MAASKRIKSFGLVLWDEDGESSQKEVPGICRGPLCCTDRRIFEPATAGLYLVEADRTLTILLKLNSSICLCIYHTP